MEALSTKTVLIGALRTINRFREESKKGKRLTFDRHVEPLYRLIELAHKDYVAGFLATKDAIASATAPAEVMTFLRNIRRGALMVRGQALARIEQMLDSDQYRDARLPPGWSSAKNFYESAKDYLYGATVPACTSWYTEYITFVEISARHLSGDCWVQKVFGNDARNDLLYAIDRTLDRIEIAFREVTQRYVLAERDLVI